MIYRDEINQIKSNQSPSGFSCFPALFQISLQLYYWVLSLHIIKFGGLSLRKISSFLQSVKDNLQPMTLGVYNILASVVRSTLDRQAIQLTPLAYLATSCRQVSHGGPQHQLGTPASLPPNQIYGHYQGGDREKLHANTINREHGFCLSKSRKPLICSLIVCRKSTSQDPQHESTYAWAHSPYQGTDSALSRHPSTLSLSFLSQLPIHYILLFLSPTVCLNPCTWLLSHPPHFSAYHTRLHHVPACMWLEQPIFGPSIDALLLCPTGWLFPSDSQWVQTCWFVSSPLAYLDPVLFCKQF
jgi:hypothetical protein